MDLSTERARCQFCSGTFEFRKLEAAPNGGAICTDWFACQQRRDKHIASFRDRMSGGPSPHGQ